MRPEASTRLIVPSAFWTPFEWCSMPRAWNRKLLFAVPHHSAACRMDRSGTPVTSAGLKFKVPFVQEVNPIDKRVLEWDGNPSDMPTKDKLYISVDLFARWRITDPLQYFLRLGDERSALVGQGLRSGDVAASVGRFNAAFDLCMIPYRADHPFNRASCPTKVMDYMATSRPVVSIMSARDACP